MKIIFDNNESAAPLAPLLLATEEEQEQFFDAVDRAIEQQNQQLIEAQQGEGDSHSWLIAGQ